MAGFSVSSIGLLLVSVKALLLLLHSKKGEVADLKCLTFPCLHIIKVNGTGETC